MKVQCPLVHLNGTSKEDLLDQVRNASIIARELKSALSTMYPNMRDYYPLGEEAYTRAKAQLLRQMTSVNEVITELSLVYEGIQTGKTFVEFED